ncbi:MAG: hypothetical protein H7334_03125 [Ferruginibacter sp.]|nr:hypothetical protein [Ferruginibacter sp.]
MKKFQMVFFGLLISLSSCKKEEVANKQILGLWNWTIQYTGNPAYSYTPQSTGIKESILFTTDGTYLIKQNSVVVNSGTYKTITANSTRGEKVMGITYSNNRVTDSAAYYYITNSNDSLIFSPDLIGSVGAGARCYKRQK